MSKKEFYNEEPAGKTILKKVARDLALIKAGIDPLSKEERLEKRKATEKAIHNFNKTQ